jgi:hypothetical protein
VGTTLPELEWVHVEETEMTFEPFVDANAVAEHVKVTRRQILAMTRRGVIPGYPMGMGSSRRVWRYKLSEIDAIVTGASKKNPERAIGQSAKLSTIAAAVPEVARRSNSNG